MLRAFAPWFGLSLLASPGNTIFDEILRSSGWRGQRRSNTLVPAYSIYNGIEDPPPPPAPADSDGRAGEGTDRRPAPRTAQCTAATGA